MKKNNLLFSIIVPIYNVEKIIDKLILSILNQNYTNFEIIIKDGLSTDNSVPYLRSLNDSRIKIYSCGDKGIYDAMNQAISFAQGDWLIFMGADDAFCDGNVLNDINNFIFENNSVKIICGNFFFKDKLVKNKFSYRMFFGNTVNHQSVFYSSEIFKLYDYSTSYKYASDYDLNLRLFLKKIKLKKINRAISYYGSNGVSSLNKATGEIECQVIRSEIFPNYLFSLLSFVIAIRQIFKNN